MKRPQPGLPPELKPGISILEWAYLMMLFATVASGWWQVALSLVSIVYYAIAFWKMPPGYLENSWKQMFKRMLRKDRR